MNDMAKQGGWDKPAKTPAIEDQELLERWKSATERVAFIGTENSWSKSEVARRAEVAIGTFSQWYSGSYPGRYDKTTTKIENFLDGVESASSMANAMPEHPALVQTRVSRELFEAFTYAQALPTIAICTVLSGLGKSYTAQQFANSRPHVFHVTLSPSSKTVHGLKADIALQIGADDRNPNVLKQSITASLKREGFNALLIVDEAQNLTPEGINELRHFRDVAGCGLVLLGNDEATTPYATRDLKHASPQVTRRIGHRLNVLQPYPEDIEAIVDAWGFEDKDLRTAAKAIAGKPGAFGALTETIRAGSMIAMGNKRALTADDLRAAYRHRGMGSL